MTRIAATGGAARIRVGASPAEKLLPPNLAALCLKTGITAGPTGDDPEVQRLSAAPPTYFAAASLTAYGIPYDSLDPEDIARKALAMDGYERATIRADGGAFNRPGSFPNLLSALANKAFDEGVEAAEVTYPAYTGRWPGDLPDFKPAPVVARSGYDSLDEVLDGAEFAEQGLAEECLSHMVLSRFGNQAKLTPALVANDDLGAWTEELLALSEAWELTKNRGCLNLLTGNVTLLDGVALYDDATHANLITIGGAAPSVTTWDAMQQKMAAQTTVGGVAFQRTRLGVVLVPPKHEVSAQQTFLPLGGTVVVETKRAASDSNLNVFRGKVTVAIEPELAASSADVWYGFADPSKFRNAAIVIAYFRGWGARGKREQWYDPATKCLHYSLEGRAGFAAKNYRTTVLNPGT